MPAPTIYRSSDSNAPVLAGVGGSLIDVLTACLVDGYGPSFATGTINTDSVLPADGDTVTIGSIVYTFKTTLGGIPYTFSGANYQQAQAALSAMISGVPATGGSYVASPIHPDVWSSLTQSGGWPISLIARRSGAAGNAIALAKSGTHHTVSGANLTGGSGSVTKAGAGWSKPFVGNPGQAIFRPPAGTRFYLQIDDTGPGAGGTRDARSWGWETMTAWNTGTGQFPTVAQSASNPASIRKSSLLDATARAWTLFVDDRTFHLFTYSGDTVGVAHGYSFGDFYSFVPGDAYKCLVNGGSLEVASVTTNCAFFQVSAVSASQAQTGHWLSRIYSGAGGSTAFVTVGDIALAPTTTIANMQGNLAFPNPADGGLYIAPLRVFDGTAPGTTITSPADLRGRLRGLYHVPHASASFADGDAFSGVGDYAGRTFIIVKGVSGTLIAVETSAWDVST